MSARTNDEDARDRSYLSASAAQAIADQLEEMRSSQRRMEITVNKLNTTWEQATGTLAVIKWLSIVLAAVGTFAVALRTYIVHPH